MSPSIIDSLILTKIVHDDDNINNKNNIISNKRELDNLQRLCIMHVVYILCLHTVIKLFDLYLKCNQIGIELMWNFYIFNIKKVLNTDISCWICHVIIWAYYVYTL